MMTRRTTILLAVVVVGLMFVFKGLAEKKARDFPQVPVVSAQTMQQPGGDTSQQTVTQPQEAATTAEVQRLTHANQQLEEYVQHLLETIKQLQADMQQGQSTLVEAQKGEQQVQQTLTETRQRLQEAQTQQAQWQERHKSTTDMLTAAQEQLKQCTTAAQAAQAEATTRHEQTVTAHQKEVGELRTSLTTAQQDKQTTQQQLEQSQQQLQRCASEAREALAVATEQHRQALAQQQKAGQEVQAALTTARQGMQTTQQKLEETQRALAEAEAQRSQWQERYRTTEATLASTRQQLQERTAEVEASQTRRQAVQAAQARTTAQLQSLHEQIMEHLREEIQHEDVMVQQHDNRVLIRMADKGVFGEGNAAIRRNGREILKKISKLLQGFPDHDVQVEGHADGLPLGEALRDRWSTNWVLSSARASVVVDCLERLGVDPARLTVAGYGSHRPLASNDTSEGRTQNRRIDIIVQPSNANHGQAG